LRFTLALLRRYIVLELYYRTVETQCSNVTVSLLLTERDSYALRYPRLPTCFNVMNVRKE